MWYISRKIDTSKWTLSNLLKNFLSFCSLQKRALCFFLNFFIHPFTDMNFSTFIILKKKYFLIIHNYYPWMFLEKFIPKLHCLIQILSPVMSWVNGFFNFFWQFLIIWVFSLTYFWFYGGLRSADYENYSYNPRKLNFCDKKHKKIINLWFLWFPVKFQYLKSRKSNFPKVKIINLFSKGI